MNTHTQTLIPRAETYTANDGLDKTAAPVATNAPGQLNVLLHNRHAFRMDSAQITIPNEKPDPTS